jgi:hypothetical protein
MALGISIGIGHSHVVALLMRHNKQMFYVHMKASGKQGILRKKRFFGRDSCHCVGRMGKMKMEKLI